MSVNKEIQRKEEEVMYVIYCRKGVEKCPKEILKRALFKKELSKVS